MFLIQCKHTVPGISDNIEICFKIKGNETDFTANLN